MHLDPRHLAQADLSRTKRDPQLLFIPCPPSQRKGEDLDATPGTMGPTQRDMIMRQKEIFSIIMIFFGPDITGVFIMTASVQLFRDHEDTVRDVW